MIEYSRETQNTIPTSTVKIIGLGGAGANMLERIAMGGMDGAELIALNTDLRTLNGCMSGEKLQLGRNLTKGLGTGGDPQLGLQAMQEAEDDVRVAIKGRRIVFLCVGLGGGTGSGAAPMVARIAREEGAFVVVFATMPFKFEGRRRRDQADAALNQLSVIANAMVTFDNTRMGELVLAKQGVHEAFAAADIMIAESIKAVIRLVVRPGLINVGLDELISALNTPRSRCLFGSGIAQGKDRVAKALGNALASPLLDQGALLQDAGTVLVHICGGENLTLFEIELLMQRLGKHVPESAQVLFGAAVDPTMDDSLSVTLISALPEERLDGSVKEATPAIVALEPTSTPNDPVVRPPVEEPKLATAEFFSTTQPAAPIAEPEPEVVTEAAPTVAETQTAEPIAEAVPVAAAVEESETELAVITESEPVPEAAPAPEEVIAEPETPQLLEAEFSPIEEPVMEMAPPPSPFVVAEEPAPARPVSPAMPVAVGAGLFPPMSKETQSIKLRSRDKGGQPELSLDGGPRGRFQEEQPNLVDGEDLDVPAFLRKKRQ